MKEGNHTGSKNNWITDQNRDGRVHAGAEFDLISKGLYQGCIRARIDDCLGSLSVYFVALDVLSKYDVYFECQSVFRKTGRLKSRRS